MDNYEGGSPMTPTMQGVNPPSVSTQASEVVLVPERAEVLESTTRSTNQTTHNQSRHASQLSEMIEQDAVSGRDLGQILQDMSHDEYWTDSYHQEDFEDTEYEDEGETDVDSQILTYISDEMRHDPLYLQKMGEVISEKIANGEDIVFEDIQSEAAARYLNAKNESIAEMSIDEKLAYLEGAYSEVLAKNVEMHNEMKELKKRISEQSETVQTLAKAVLELAKSKKKDSEDDEDEMSFLELLVRIMGALLQEFTRYEKNGTAQTDQTEPIGVEKFFGGKIKKAKKSRTKGIKNDQVIAELPVQAS